jgi:hypothetical protein
MSTFKKYRAGLHNVGSYQVAGLPFITGSSGMPINTEEKVTFPNVTKRVLVTNHTGDTIRVHFNSKAASSDDAGEGVINGNHFIELDSDEDSIDMSVKCKEIYISAPNNGSARQWKIYAELTAILTEEMVNLTGSGLTD